MPVASKEISCTLPHHNASTSSRICPCLCLAPSHLAPSPESSQSSAFGWCPSGLCHSPSICWKTLLQSQEPSLCISSRWILSSTCHRSCSPAQFQPLQWQTRLSCSAPTHFLFQPWSKQMYFDYINMEAKKCSYVYDIIMITSKTPLRKRLSSPSSKNWAAFRSIS